MNLDTKEKFTKEFKYLKQTKLLISDGKLKDKLPEFDSKIELPKNIIVDDDSFDSEENNTYFQGKNALFKTIKKYYSERNKMFTDDDLQKYYQSEIIGNLETDNNSNNSNIT